MREHLFKAKRVDNGEWVEGRSLIQAQSGKKLIIPIGSVLCLCYCEATKEVMIQNTLLTEVDPNTVCEYTGRRINGIMAFEGDRIGFYYLIPQDDGTDLKVQSGIAEIIWNDEYSLYDLKWVVGNQTKVIDECDISADEDYDYPFGYFLEYFDNSHDIFNGYEIIGNIFDNPELLGSEAHNDTAQT